MTKQMLPLVFLFFFVFSFTTHAQWASSPAVNNPIVRAGNNQTGHRLVSDGQGGAIFCWTDERVMVASSDVYAQRIDKDGYVRWTVNGVVVSSATNSQSGPDIVSDGAGGAIIAWTDTRNGNNDIYIQRIDASGNVLWTPDGIAVTTDTSNQADPKLTTDGRGGAIVVWNQGHWRLPPGSKIYAQRYDANGTARWSTPVLVSGTLRFSNAPSITSDGKGGAYIAYAYYPRPEYDVYAQRLDSNGVVQWAAKGVGVATSSGSQDAPLLVGDGTGNAFLGYLDWTSTTQANLHIVVLRPDGTQATSLRATSTNGGQLNHNLSNIAPGKLAISWQDGRTAGKVRAYVQVLDTNGTKMWAADGVAVSNRTGDQVAPSVVSDGSGGVIVAFEDKTKGALNTDIYAQRVSDAGAPLWTAAGVPVCTANNSQQFARMLPDGQNGAIVAWEDYRPSFSNVEIYASKILADGSFPIAPPQLTLSSKALDFGDVAINSTSSKQITLSNPGGAAVTIASISSSDPQFSLTPDDNTIPPGGDVTAFARFTPAGKNSFSATIVINSNSSSGPDTIRVTGRGTGAAAIQVDKTTMSFGTVTIGASKSLPLLITNPGTDTLNVSSITTSNASFTVSIASRVLAPGASFTDSVRFAPSATGPITANLTLNSNAAGSPTVISLTGTGAGVVTLTMDNTTISFGDVTVGANKDASVTITNTGNDTLRISTFTSSNPRFTLETPLSVIAPSAAKAFTLRFAPNAAGPLSGTFTVTSNAVSSPHTITVDGVGVVSPAISFSPTQLLFDTVKVGNTKDLTLTILNPGGQTLSVSSITSTNADFSAVAGQCEVAGGSSFNETIRFAPSVLGDRSGVLIIVSNAPTSPDTVLVRGVGSDVSDVQQLNARPGEFALAQNYPNPFNPSTAIRFSIPAQGALRLSVLDHLGREVAVLAEGVHAPGTYTCSFDATSLASGLYIYRLSFEGNTISRKMLLLR
ncbi:MAG: choice-of-anchor D domain-containing protein [Bacteroidia bacterium]|nr:choice-of-anchor D domain-containing protein [Bacteroidia bacterium]